jgi:NTP pyrophosphatase (non-canonical NTP hydrolase)
MAKNKYTQMVLDLAKSGLIMREEWTNEEKETLLCLNELFYIGNKINSFISRMPLYNNSLVYEVQHMSFALLIEIGELSDPFKKKLIYRKEYTEESKKNILEEIGDNLFYLTWLSNNALKSNNEEIIIHCENFTKVLEHLCKIFNTTIDECKELNYQKLSVRYKGLKYSNEKAIERADKNKGE